MPRAKYLAAVLFTACLLQSQSSLAAPEFTKYYGKDSVQEGNGGAMKSVEGVDIWSEGAPPRRFELIGFLADRRHKTGLVGMMRMKGLEKEIAKAAKANGGDAVILMASDTEVIGHISSGQATANTTTNPYGTGYQSTTRAQGGAVAAPVAKQNTRYAVIRYLAEESTPAVDEVAGEESSAFVALEIFENGTRATSTPITRVLGGSVGFVRVGQESSHFRTKCAAGPLGPMSLQSVPLFSGWLVEHRQEGQAIRISVTKFGVDNRDSEIQSLPAGQCLEVTPAQVRVCGGELLVPWESTEELQTVSLDQGCSVRYSVAVR